MGIDTPNRSALEDMLKEYSTKQLVDEVLIAWDELTKKNEDFSELKQRIRLLELDLDERKDGVAPEVEKLKMVESELNIVEKENLKLNNEIAILKEKVNAQESILTLDERNRLLDENINLGNTIEEQTEIIEEMEKKIDQMLSALQKAANVGLTSISLEEFQKMKDGLEDLELKFEGERAAVIALEDERGRLREIIDKLRGMLDLRDKRILEVEEQVENLMRGPKSISAEHDYLVEQIEELKRRLVERNREYEVLRRRERGLNNDVFERDERIQQMQLTITDLEAGLQDRTAELKALEKLQYKMNKELDDVRRSERTRGVVGKMFSDSLSLTKNHEKRKDLKNRKKKERILETPGISDIEDMVDGKDVKLYVDERDVEVSNVTLDKNPIGPGGSAIPLIDEDEKE